MENRKTKWNLKSVPIPEHMKDFDKDEYPLLKPGHSTSTLIVSMFLAFTIGFVVCHELYVGIR